jgi:hypothetical protein
MSYDSAAMVQFWPIVIIFQYSWPEEPSDPRVSQNTVVESDPFTFDPSIFINLSSGRVVVSGHSLNILDPNVLYVHYRLRQYPAEGYGQTSLYAHQRTIGPVSNH